MGRQWIEVWINALHKPPPIWGSDADVAISNPLQFQCTDTQMQIQTQIQNKLHMIFSYCYICTLSLFHIDIFIIFAGGWLWWWISRTKRGVGDIRKCEILEKTISHFLNASLLTNLPIHSGLKTFSYCCSCWPGHLKENKVSSTSWSTSWSTTSWSSQKPGTRRHIEWSELCAWFFLL